MAPRQKEWHHQRKCGFYFFISPSTLNVLEEKYKMQSLKLLHNEANFPLYWIFSGLKFFEKHHHRQKLQFLEVFWWKYKILKIVLDKLTNAFKNVCRNQFHRMTSVFDKASLKPNSHEKRKVTNGPKNYDTGKGVEDR